MIEHLKNKKAAQEKINESLLAWLSMLELALTTK